MSSSDENMARLLEDICTFLENNGFEYSVQMRHDLDVICTRTANGSQERIILPVEIKAESEEEAAAESELTEGAIDLIRSQHGFPLIITEDRWHMQQEMLKARLLAHLELFGTVYARNCEIRRIEKAEAEDFLNAHHSYGYAACRYRFGMFLKRNTGNISTCNGIQPGTLVAVATFSNARKWTKEDKVICSYEWTRFASLPGLRISGAMGKMLKAFIKEAGPDDIMSYADREWSEGEVYKTLGFREEIRKDPVMFVVDNDWKRTPVKRICQDGTAEKGYRFFRNFGSSKFRLKLTDYK